MAEPTRGLLQFHVGKVPVLVRPVFFLIPLISAYSLGPRLMAEWAVMVFGSVLLHELGHAWAMRAFGFGPRVELHGMGGWTMWPDGARPTSGQRLAVSVSGPGIELALGTAIYLANRFFPVTGHGEWVVEQLLWINIGWALINLLPVLPWDGGHALDSLVSLTFGPHARVAAVSSMLGGAALTALAIALKQIMLGYIGVIGVTQGWNRWQRAPAIDVAASIDQLVSAGQVEQLPVLFATRLGAGDWMGAFVIATKSLTLRRDAEAAALLQTLYEKTQNGTIAYTAARALCRLNRLADAQLMLERAVADGVTAVASYQAEEDFTPLRSTPQFTQLLDRLSRMSVARPDFTAQ